MRIEAQLYAAFDKKQMGTLEAEAQRHGRFLGLSLDLVTHYGGDAANAQAKPP